VNPAFEPIKIDAEQTDDLMILAEYLGTIPKRLSMPQLGN
jgi:hypothetical protein